MIDAARAKRVVEATTRTKPRAATYWSCRTLAKAQCVSPATIQRIWDANGLQPHRTKTFKLSTDKERNGTTTLFAALNMLNGKIIGECLPRHRHQEFLTFLRGIDREFPQQLDLHLIVDDYGTHKQPRVQRWLSKHRRFHLHFTPTSSSWLILVERRFRELTTKGIRRGAFHSVPELIDAIEEYLEAQGRRPQGVRVDRIRGEGPSL